MPLFPDRTLVDLPDGRRLAVALRPGPGQPIVLLHGMTDSADSFRLMLPFLHDRSLVMPDLRGHGGSPGDSDMSVPAIAGDISAMMTALRLPKAVVVGHSLGALSALWLTAQRPEQVAGLVTLAGALSVPADLLDRLERTVMALPDPLPPDHPFFQEWHLCERPVPWAFLRLLAQQTGSMRRSDWLAILTGLRRLDLREAALRLGQPVLVVAGAADPLFPASDHKVMTGTFPRGAGILLPETGHNPHWDRPEDIARRILDFAGPAT